MPAHVPGLRRLVARARRRMRLNRAVAAGSRAAVVAACAGLLWVLASRVTPLPDIDVAVTVALFGAVTIVVAGAALVRIPPRWAAWAADRWLGSRELYVTAVELLEGISDRPLGALAERQVAAAERAAAGFTSFPQPVRVPAHHLAAGGVAVALAVGAALLPNPQDAVRAERLAERARIDEQADRLRETAEDLREQGADDPERQETAGRLDRLADELDAASLEEALTSLAEQQAMLAQRLAQLSTGPDGGSAAGPAGQRTALAGLARELEDRPLAAGATVREQLEELAGELAGSDPARQTDLARRLDELAAALGAQPQLAASLGQAAGALRAGDQSGAAAALGQASSAVASALQRLDTQTALAQAAGAVDAAAAELRGAPGQVAQGQGQGQEQSQGQGQGQGQRRGQGQGQGQGEGQGGGGGGSPSGRASVEDSGAREGRGSGSATGSGQQSASDLDTQTVYDPPQRLATDGDDLRLTGRDSGVGGEIDSGRVQGGGLRNDALVPYLDVLAEYAQQAGENVEHAGYPPRLRTTVRDYFNELAAPAGADQGD